jgi:hypothetical protein
MRIIDLGGQRSDGWHEFRKGKIGGTRLGSLYASRQYTKDDIVKLLEGRGVEFKKTAAKGVLETLLTDDDKDLLSTDSAKKLEYYQILADQIAVDPEDEDGGKWLSNDGSFMRVMQRGTDMEEEALKLFAEKYEKTLAFVDCCVADEDERIFNSPDALIWPDPVDGGRMTELSNTTFTEAVELKCLASAKHLMAFFERKVPEEYWTQKVQYFVVNPDLQRLYFVFYDPRIPMLPMFCLKIEREDLGHWPETMLKYQLRTLRELDDLTVRLFEESENILLPARTEKGITIDGR